MRFIKPVPFSRALPASLSLAALALFVAIAPAQADVMVQQKTSSSGVMGMGATEGHSTMIVSGEKQQTETELTVKGMGGPNSTLSIVRLDKELIWNLDQAKKEYTEITFAEMKQMMEGAKSELSKQSGGTLDPGALEFSVEMETPGAKKEINGFATEQKILHMSGQSPTGEGEIVITADMWVAKDIPGYDELRAFQSSFAKKLGIDPSLFQSAGGMAQMMGGSVGKLAEEMQKLEGYPILMEMSIQIPGVQGMPEGMPEIDMEAMMEAARSGDMAALEKMKADMEKKSKEMEASPPDAGAKGTMTLTVQHEVTAITTSEVPKVGFDVPEGYKEVEMKMPFEMPSRK